MFSKDTYSVGWICAVEKERVAAQLLLDERHDIDHLVVSENDDNIYTLGKMGNHYVVIASLPDGEYGTSGAAGVARNMLHTFQRIRIGLLVGLGGGVPSPNGIRLGDVVVSSPREATGGVFHYDSGISTQDEEFRQTGHLDNPPVLLRAAVAGLRADHVVQGNGLERAIGWILQDRPESFLTQYRKPDDRTDQPFKTEVEHTEASEDTKDGEQCCKRSPTHNVKKLVDRSDPAQRDNKPAIHYGIIASGESLMRDAKLRDKFARQKGILCFENEAAGLMNHFPCLVIRGICDYADSHRYSQWQGYASLAAAAYAKALIKKIPLNSVEAMAPARAPNNAGN